MVRKPKWAGLLTAIFVEINAHACRLQIFNFCFLQVKARTLTSLLLNFFFFGIMTVAIQLMFTKMLAKVFALDIKRHCR